MAKSWNIKSFFPREEREKPLFVDLWVPLPRVVATFPENGAKDVDHSIGEIWVNFSEPMMDKTLVLGYWGWGRKVIRMIFKHCLFQYMQT